MSAAEIADHLSEAVPSAPPTPAGLREWCEALGRACRAIAARQDALVAAVKVLETRVAELEDVA